MAHLFIINNKTVFPNPETLLIEPFKSIWERDKTKGKQTAIKELTYIEFVSSFKKSNPYRQYPEDKKREVLKEEIIKDVNWEPDKLIFEGIEKIKTLQEEASTTYGYYLDAKFAAEKMRKFFREFDINERNMKSGNPIYKPRDITSAINDTEKTLSNLKALEKKVEEELYEETKTKADKQISPFADPNSLDR